MTSKGNPIHEKSGIKTIGVHISKAHLAPEVRERASGYDWTR